MSKISVIIPCYNQGKFLIQALESLIQQTHQNWEAIVIDDGSTESVFINDLFCPIFLDKRVSVYCQENKGLPATRNVGLEKATGDYIQFLDADDYLMPDKFAIQLKELENADIAYSGYFAFIHPFENEGVTTDTKFDESKATKEFKNIGFFSKEELETIELKYQTNGLKKFFDPKDFE